MDTNNKINVKRMVGVAVFIAAVVALQMLGSFVRIGTFSVSLVLVPIAIGAAVFGPAAGALLGAAFGAVVLINCAIGVDIGGYMMWAANPPLTAALCILKGAIAGYVAGVFYRTAKNISIYAGVLSAAIVCPIVNTGIFILCVVFLYRDILVLWAGDTNYLYFAFIGLAGTNFLLELCVNIVLCSAAARIIKVIKL